MNRLPKGYEARRHVMSLTWSRDAPALAANGTKKKSNDMKWVE